MPAPRILLRHCFAAAMKQAAPLLMLALLQLTPAGQADASTIGTDNANRQDRTLGTFTEGMEIGKDEESGDRILRSAPSPTGSGNGTETETPPVINIEITPKHNHKRHKQ